MLAPIQGELELACELLSPRHRGTFSLLPVPPGAIPWQVWESAVFDFLMFGVLLSGVFGLVPLPAMRWLRSSALRSRTSRPRSCRRNGSIDGRTEVERRSTR